MLFDLFTQVLREGIIPCLTCYAEWLTGDGLLLGVGIIGLPLLARIIHIFRKIF